MISLTRENYARMEALLSDRRFRLTSGILYKVLDTKGRLVPFEPYPAQCHFFDNLWYQNIILKARQLGMTTAIQLWILDDTIHRLSVSSGIIAHKREDCAKFFDLKIKLALENLPEPYLDQINVVKNDHMTLQIENKGANNETLKSTISVTTSTRSSTVQNLHISEHGPLCTFQPQKASELKSGALNTLHEGGRLFIESTAAGATGDFYDYCVKAEEQALKGETLTRLDRKFFFYPWYIDSRNQLEPTRNLEFTDKWIKYFEKLEDNHAIKLTIPQRFWYVKKSEEQGDEMKKEHPSTSAEAFEAVIEGAIYGDQLESMKAEGRLTRVPHDPSLPVFTAWDLGRSKGNAMAVVFYQFDGIWFRYIDYHYKEFSDLPETCRVVTNKPYNYGAHFGPHDINVVDISTSESLHRYEICAALGVNFEMRMDKSGKLQSVIPKTSPVERNDVGRMHMDMCMFDLDGTSDRHERRGGSQKFRVPGLVTSLQNYHHKYDENKKMFMAEPEHNWASNLSDAYGYSSQSTQFLKRSLRRTGARPTGQRRTYRTSRPSAAA